MNNRNFKLPPHISELVQARNKLREHYQNIILKSDDGKKLDFTFDGKLVGDIGEAIAVELFGITLSKCSSEEGIDGYAPNGNTVQVKATGTKRGPNFRPTKTRAQHLLFFELNFETESGTIVFNGPEAVALEHINQKKFNQQRPVTPNQIRAADLKVKDSERLKRIK